MNLNHFSKFFSGKHFIPSEKQDDYDVDKEIGMIGSFVKSGLVVMSIILLSGIAIAYGQKKLVNESAVETAALISNRELPIYCVEEEKPRVALSFDAAWGNEDTQEILDILEKKKVHVTFFMTGGWVEKYPDDVKAIQKAGHELGNHSENHKQMSTLSAEQCKEEIMAVHNKVKELTGVEMQCFRPPYGDYNDTVITTARECGYYPIQWDVDSLDWKDYGTESIINTVLNHKHLGNGSIILCHNGAKYTPAALEALIDGLQEKGFELVKMSDLIIKEDCEIDTEGRQHKTTSASPDAAAN